MARPLDHIQIAVHLALIGNGAALSYWNGTIDVNLLEPGLTNSSRRILASGGKIDAALFERANARLTELEAAGAIRRGPLGWMGPYVFGKPPVRRRVKQRPVKSS